MVKYIINEPGRTFHEYCLLPGYTKKDCIIQNISLETRLGGLRLKIPILGAAMTSLMDYDMALALNKEGGIGVLPVRMPHERKIEVVKALKSYEMGFVEDPVSVREGETVEDALDKIQQYGHSKIPVTKKNNQFLGLFTFEHYLATNPRLKDKVTSAMLKKEQIPYCVNPAITINETKLLFENEHKDSKYLIVLDGQDGLVKIAFKKDVEKVKVGIAISTYPGWKKTVEEMVALGVDLINLDTSDAYNEFVKGVLVEYMDMHTGVPFCAGNVVTYEGARFLMEHGADIVKFGMSSGSICTTQREKSVGRAPLTALKEGERAKKDHYLKTGKEVHIVIDGGIITAADMAIALTMADAVMCGGYLNKFYEAAAEKFDESGQITTIEDEITHVATWGEGSERAYNLERYGQSRQTFFAEGIEGKVPYAGRLKPALKKDMMKVKAALSNAGCMDLEEFRNEAVIELISPASKHIISTTHSVIEKGKG
jgi:IMP dehydrogenase